jgi:hypothetical protein
MKSLLTTVLVCVPVLGLAAYAHARSQDHGMQMPEFMRPTEQHALLQRSVGTWDAVVTMQGMDGKDEVSKGTQTVTKLSDYHTVTSFEGTMMGAPFTGHGIDSYCPIREQFMGTWADSMSPAPLLLQGNYDAAKKELVMKGEMIGMDGQLGPCRTVVKYKDEDHMSFALHGTGPDGKDMQMVSIEYTRRK